MTYTGDEIHEYIMINGDSSREFNIELKKMMKDGWYPWGELQATLTHPTAITAHINYSLLLERTIKPNDPPPKGYMF